MVSTEYTQHWYELGAQKEAEFLEKYPQFGLQMNPAKATDVTAVDFIGQSGRLWDLKSVSTPFFKAARYGVAPQFAVTYNEGDFRKYPLETGLIFDVNFKRSEMFGIIVEELHGIWRTTQAKIHEFVNSIGLLPHSYLKRENDRWNENNSFVLDLSSELFECIEVRRNTA